MDSSLKNTQSNLTNTVKSYEGALESQKHFLIAGMQPKLETLEKRLRKELMPVNKEKSIGNQNILSGCHDILARCCASQMQPFPFGTQRPESLLPQLARLSIQTVSWRASQKDPGAYVLPHGTVHQNHAWNIDQLHVGIDALSPNIDIISVLTYPQF